ncbi:pilin [Arenimonas terrae]|jgi:type IV pilus assembly protein PilA|uniref:DUF4339 domain-containing protein n=1 Tax=Arenimonas terrae TaxID=2546226 RepID=A0A5C4RR65_9GAMM|nr:pilin [Arenimonas terrae]TNJ33037.1 DUF4339 domain-containing protein [Arenimonas terrae]
MSTWYFVDHGHNRQGPVDAEALAEAHRQGRLDYNSLVWREGMAEWAPLGQFQSELGLKPPGLPAPGIPAPSVAPAPPAKNSGCGPIAIVAACVGVALIAVLAILAAIAIPAYNDYLVRAKVATILAEAQTAKVHVSEFVANTDRCPRDAAELQLGAPYSEGLAALDVVPLGDGVCVIELTLGPLPQAATLADSRIYLRREQDGSWSCTSDLVQQKYLPATCR